MRQQRKTELSALMIFLALAVAGRALSQNTPPQLPQRTILWAWQRAEDLSFIDTNKFAVAYLACSVLVKSDRLQVTWRQQKLKVPEQALMMPVIRIDTERRGTADLSESRAEELASLVAKIATRPRTSALQIDFDAVETERPFYRRLLKLIRTKLPDNLALSMTALASWCLFDDWLQDLPVDETVPMMFSLGADRQKLQHYFATGHDFLNKRCGNALGLSLEDPQINKLMIPLSKQRKIPVRVYMFTKTAWTRDKVEAVRTLLGAQ